MINKNHDIQVILITMYVKLHRKINYVILKMIMNVDHQETGESFIGVG